ncbi:MAG: HNH endonuclease signature motif containing protein [Candidatus Bathyarchaeia archaeon]
MRTDILEKKDIILKWVEENQSKAFMCRELKCRPITLDAYLEKMNIKYEGNKGLKGLKVSPHKKKAEIFLVKGSLITSHKLKLKLFEENIKEEKCEKCGIVDWNNEKVSFELHHIDGDRFNNLLENLKILCPNCHSQTNNYCSKK